jgi:hypothetical protein
MFSRDIELECLVLVLSIAWSPALISLLSKAFAHLQLRGTEGDDSVPASGVGGLPQHRWSIGYWVTENRRRLVV